jgi:hypothetical protein
MTADSVIMGAMHLSLRYQVPKLSVNAKLLMSLLVRLPYVSPCVGLTDLALHGREEIPPVLPDINDQQETRDFDHDRRWSEGVRYVYDAAAERARQRIRDGHLVGLSIEQ